jgi:hypothetical protein
MDKVLPMHSRMCLAFSMLQGHQRRRPADSPRHAA